ncbi:MAG: exosortase/archaeosortase family protein [Bacteroidota bacterium]|nr:exosortase/archaeosortase family protein [Bacteroidota bacterium]
MQPSATVPAGNQLLYRFLFVAAAIYLAWFFGYERWLGPDGRLDAVLCHNIASSATAVLQALGFAAAVDAHIPTLVLMAGEQSVIVGAACNGLVLYALFAGFVVAFPGPWRHKVWFIPAGILLIWLLNVVRVAALAINQHYSHQTVDFNHHYTFTFVVYTCIFGLWMLWARRMATPGGVARFAR